MRIATTPVPKRNESYTVTKGSSPPLVIVNPKSAGGSTREKWSGIASDLRSHFGPFSVAFTKGPGDGIDLAHRAADAGRQFIIACGGDGTINEIANGILLSGKDVELGVFPSGTGGDFRRSINMPQGTREAARALKRGTTEMIDVGKVSFTAHDDQPAERYFLNVTSFGLAASIIERVKGNTALSWLPLATGRGRASFALSSLQEVISIGPTMVRVRIDGKDESTLQTVNFCVANARYFGGGMKIAPDAKINDGFLDVINIGDIRTAKIILNAYTLYLGTHMDLPEVKATLAKRIEARPSDPDQEIQIEIDGELAGRLPATYEVVPASLRVRVPRDP